MNGLVLNITNLCNFRCKTCLREYGRYNNLPFELLKKAIIQGKELNLKGVGLTGGEPFMHPGFKEIVEFLVSENINFGIITNGYNIKKYDFIFRNYKKNLSRVVISLDGATKEVHDKIRQKGSFERAVNSAKKLINMNIRTEIQTCINKLNIDQTEDIVILAESIGINTMSFLGIIRTDENKNICLSRNERLKLVQRIKKIKSKRINVDISQSIITNRDVNFCIHADYLLSLELNPKGEIVYCCDTVRDGAVIGSLKNENFADLYKKALDWTAYLKKVRLNKIQNNQIDDDFDCCNFCSNVLRDRIK